jgi:3-oxoacyl-[acyl-carrier protein] reductase
MRLPTGSARRFRRHWQLDVFRPSSFIVINLASKDFVMDLQLKGKRAVITGGSKGIGLAIAMRFAKEGAIPILVSRTTEVLEKAALAIQQETGILAQTLTLDLATNAGITQLMSRAGDIDILVNNAGAIPGGSLTDVSDDKWRQAWELKLFGYINLIRAVLPVMEQRGSGVISNIIGMAGAVPRAEYICGSTANAALMAFTQAVGGTSPRKGVRVFGINPSPTRSDRMEGMLRLQATKKLGDENRWLELTAGLPFGRMTEPTEIADLTVFSCSPLAGYLSGTVLNIDGGQSFASPA